MKTLLLAVAILAATSDDPRFRLSEEAWAHMREAQFERALADFRQVVEISREMHDRRAEARAINFIGLLYQQIGEQASALAHYQQALPIAREIGDRKLEGEVLYHLGWLHFQRNEFRKALPYYTESLAARRDTGDAYGEAMTLLGLGMTHTSLGEFEIALQFENEALPIAERTGDKFAQADALDQIGTALTFLHRPAEAIEKHTRALELRKGDGQAWSMSFSLSGLAHAQHELGQLREACASMAELIDLAEGSRRNVATRRFRGSMFARMRGHYDRYIEYLMEARDVSTAFAASERARARLTLDAVQDALVRADADAGGTLLQREQSLQNQIERAGKNLDELLAQLTQVEDDIRREYPKLAAARDEMPLTAEQVQTELLDRETAVVEFSVTKEHVFAWVVTRDAINGRELSREILDVAERLHTLLAAGDQRTTRHEIDTLIERLQVLVIKPLALPKVTKLLIVPDGALFYVPFAALTGRYEITIAPSASAAALMRKASASRTYVNDVAIFADPVFSADDPRVGGKTRTDSQFKRLPSTRLEADAIAQLASRGTRKALDFDASRRTVLTGNLGRYRAVHFATHALIDAQHPESSGIVLSLVDRRGLPVNGFLRVHDVYSLDVASDLVVLSACRTAMGKELRGEGIVGIVNAFMHAGAPRVVASYWDVKDEATSELMQRFYRGIFRKGLTPAAALRDAQRSMRREARWKSPYYWAAFAVWGS